MISITFLTDLLARGHLLEREETAASMSYTTSIGAFLEEERLTASAEECITSPARGAPASGVVAPQQSAPSRYLLRSSWFLLLLYTVGKGRVVGRICLVCVRRTAVKMYVLLNTCNMIILC
jgi:hypothetical protein